jgi:hypothetical protein
MPIGWFDSVTITRGETITGIIFMILLAIVCLVLETLYLRERKKNRLFKPPVNNKGNIPADKKD